MDCPHGCGPMDESEGYYRCLRCKYERRFDTRRDYEQQVALHLASAYLGEAARRVVVTR